MKQAVNQLGEHFDCVRIFASKNSEGNTRVCTSGYGNWYAQLGQVIEWVECEKEEAREQVRDKSDE